MLSRLLNGMLFHEANSSLATQSSLARQPRSGGKWDAAEELEAWGERNEKLNRAASREREHEAEGRQQNGVDGPVG